MAPVRLAGPGCAWASSLAGGRLLPPRGSLSLCSLDTFISKVTLTIGIVFLWLYYQFVNFRSCEYDIYIYISCFLESVLFFFVFPFHSQFVCPQMTLIWTRITGREQSHP